MTLDQLQMKGSTLVNCSSARAKKNQLIIFSSITLKQGFSWHLFFSLFGVVYVLSALVYWTLLGLHRPFVRKKCKKWLHVCAFIRLSRRTENRNHSEMESKSIAQIHVPFPVLL